MLSSILTTARSPSILVDGFGYFYFFKLGEGTLRDLLDRRGGESESLIPKIPDGGSGGSQGTGGAGRVSNTVKTAEIGTPRELAFGAKYFFWRTRNVLDQVLYSPHKVAENAVSLENA